MKTTLLEGKNPAHLDKHIIGNLLLNASTPDLVRQKKLITGVRNEAGEIYRLIGAILTVREDVGRHNALDKLIGALARGGARPPGFAIMSSRASYELVQKAARADIGLLATISAPTALAVRMAERAGICLVGFARQHGCVVYAHAGRLRAE